ncbi:MAG: lyase family protein [Patescibacteria group bacterium]|jgi:adenylosuccinate lyase
MHPRYEDKNIKRIFSDEFKLDLWQKLELAVLQARVNLKRIPKETYNEIADRLNTNPIDLDWWRNRDKEIGHDLNAFLDERLRFLPHHLHQYFHEGLTSYDTEESPFVLNLEESLNKVSDKYEPVKNALIALAKKYRYTIMMARTHGQEAELQSFGKRALTWLGDAEIAYEQAMMAATILNFSKLAGAIGNYGSLDPELEEETLRILDLKPYYGATQIMPRVLYAPIAQGLCNLSLVMQKISLDIRLSARSGRPLMREPFGRKQKGSSAMPHKKNPISLEQVEGQIRLIKAYSNAITENIVTWEERAIEQSCVERVAWPDLFHAVIRILTVMEKTLNGLTVYPDHMLDEVVDSRGTYAAGEAKEFLKKHLTASDLGHEDVYRIVQLASFNAFFPSVRRLMIRDNIPESYDEAFKNLEAISKLNDEPRTSIKDIIRRGELRFSSELDIPETEVRRYNACLKEFFDSIAPDHSQRLEVWEKVFNPAERLKYEDILFQKTLKKL